MADYEFTMPYPPSVNGMWRVFRNRSILSKRGREYRIKAIEAIEALGLGGELIDSKLTFSMIINPPTLRKYDVDNFTKAVFDSLTHAKFWVDDEQVQMLTIEKGIKTAGGNVTIKINTIKV